MIIRGRSLLVVLFVAALAIRLTAGVWWQGRLPEEAKFGFADSESYWTLAQTIVQGQNYQFGGEDARVFRSPGYPLLLAGLFSLVGDDPPVLWGRVLGALLGVAAVGGVYWLSKKLFDSKTALLAAALAALYPGAIAMSILILSEAAFCPLMLLQLIFWRRAMLAEKKSTRFAAALLGGLAAGAATLVRPSWLLFTPMALGLILLFCQQRRQQVIVGSIVLLGLAVAMTPWWIRNYKVTGQFVPTTLQTGASLYDGLNPQATGASDMRFVAEFQAAQHRADAARDTPPPGVFEARLDRRMHDASVQWARENPTQVAQLAVVKMIRMWNLWPNAKEFQSWPFRIMIAVGYAPLLFFSLWGAWKYLGRGAPYLLCCLPAIYLSCLHVVFVSSIRYRQPAMLPMIVLAAAAIACALWKDSGTADIEINTIPEETT